MSWSRGSLRLGGSGPGSLLATSSSSFSGPRSSSLASVHSWGVRRRVEADRRTPSIRPAPGLSQGHLSPAPPPAHLLPVLRGPGVPQRQGTAPPPCHGPHAVGILHARAEGHEAAAARTNLCLGWGGRWQIQLQGQGFRDLDPDSLEQDQEGAQTSAALSPTASPPRSGTILGQVGTRPPLGSTECQTGGWRVGAKRRRDSIRPRAPLLLPTLCPTRFWILGIRVLGTFSTPERARMAGSCWWGAEKELTV